MTRGIDQLLCADAANADETKGLFDWFDAALLGAFNRATRMFDWFTALIEHHGSDGEDLRAIHQCREALGARDGAELTRCGLACYGAGEHSAHVRDGDVR
jgi:hypothetical protein